MKQKIYKTLLILLAIYSLFFITGAILAPILAHFGYYNLAGKLDFIFFPVCHRNPARVFHIFNYPLSICARCFGTYLGTFLACILTLTKHDKLKFAPILTYLTLDMSLNYIFKIDTGNFSRFLAGICLGLIIVKFIGGKMKRFTACCQYSRKTRFGITYSDSY